MTETKLAQLRAKRGLSQQKVASACGLSQSLYAKLELRRSSASPQTAAKLAAFFGHEITEMQILYPERYESMKEAV